MTRLLNLLIVEDCESDIKLFEHFFEHHKFYNTLTFAKSLAEARQKLVEDSFDMVMLDIGLPDGNGLTLIPEITTMDPSIMVVCTSSDSEISTVLEAEKLGVTAFIRKPLNWEILQSLVQRVGSLYFGLVTDKNPKTNMKLKGVLAAAIIAAGISHGAIGEPNAPETMDQMAKMTLPELMQIRTTTTTTV
jgi:DNA-binding NtrC family response regulator